LATRRHRNLAEASKTRLNALTQIMATRGRGLWFIGGAGQNAAHGFFHGNALLRGLHAKTGFDIGVKIANCEDGHASFLLEIAVIVVNDSNAVKLLLYSCYFDGGALLSAF
jgi:hypothetical protein